MKERKWSRYVYIFAVFIGIILFFPDQVYAKNTLVTCKYAGKGENITTRYTLTIYDDYSVEGQITRWNGRKVEGGLEFDTQYNKLHNAEALKKSFQKREGANICPSHISLISGYNVAVNSFLIEGYYGTYEQVQEVTSKKTTILQEAARGALSGSGSGVDKNIFDSLIAGAIANTNGVDSININIFDSLIEWAAGQAISFTYIVTEAKEAILPNGEIITLNESNSSISTGAEKYKECVDVLGDPTDSKSVAWLLQKLFNYIKVLGPILVILFSALDFTKTILASDEEAMKKAQKRLGIRLICAVGIYFLPIIITLILNIVFGGNADASTICGIK